MLRLLLSARCRYRAIILVALLVVLGQQAVESSHAHTTDESAAHCLLCKGSTPIAVPSVVSFPAMLAASASLATAIPHAAPVRFIFQPPVRGPPEIA